FERLLARGVDHLATAFTRAHEVESAEDALRPALVMVRRKARLRMGQLPLHDPDEERQALRFVGTIAQHTVQALGEVGVLYVDGHDGPFRSGACRFADRIGTSARAPREREPDEEGESGPARSARTCERARIGHGGWSLHV